MAPEHLHGYYSNQVGLPCLMSPIPKKSASHPHPSNSRSTPPDFLDPASHDFSDVESNNAFDKAPLRNPSFPSEVSFYSNAKSKSHQGYLDPHSRATKMIANCTKPKTSNHEDRANWSQTKTVNFSGKTYGRNRNQSGNSHYARAAPSASLTISTAEFNSAVSKPLRSFEASFKAFLSSNPASSSTSSLASASRHGTTTASIRKRQVTASAMLKKKETQAPTVVELDDDDDDDDNSGSDATQLNFFAPVKPTPSTSIRIGSDDGRRKSSRQSAVDNGGFDWAQIRDDIVILEYPKEGPWRHIVTGKDLKTLKSHHFLNDSIIDFYLKYLVTDKLPEPVRQQSFAFSSFFFKRLADIPKPEEMSEGQGPEQRRHERVKKWTKNVNLFEKEFILVPVNRGAHWFLVVIYGLPRAFENAVKPLIGKTTPGPDRSKVADSLTKEEATNSGDSMPDWIRRLAYGDDNNNDATFRDLNQIPDEVPPLTLSGDPCIFIFDSLGCRSSSAARTATLLRTYVEEEAKAKLEFSGFNFKDQLPMVAPRVPRQPNGSDCGIFLLRFAKEFLSNPHCGTDEKNLWGDRRKWFDPQEGVNDRSRIRDTILSMGGFG